MAPRSKLHAPGSTIIQAGYIFCIYTSAIPAGIYVERGAWSLEPQIN